MELGREKKQKEEERKTLPELQVSLFLLKVQMLEKLKIGGEHGPDGTQPKKKELGVLRIRKSRLFFRMALKADLSAFKISIF